MPLQLRLAELPQIESVALPVLALALRDAALLTWLAVEGPTSRDQLASLLWPASSELHGRTALRQRLFRLKKALGRDVAVGSPVLRLADDIEHDLSDSSTLMGDLVLADAPRFDAWLMQQRQQRREREIEALNDQAQALEEAGKATAALSVAKALLRLQPQSEAAHRRVIRLQHLAGDRAAALAAFDACEQMLRHEFGAKPSSATLDLLATVEQTMSSVRHDPGCALPAAVLRPPRMVGRKRELQTLRSAWDAAQVAVVVGEAGMGKSRLLAELADGDSGVVRASGRPGDAGVPFATLSRLLRAVGARHAAAPLAEGRAQLARVLPELGPAGSGFGAGQWLQLLAAIAAHLQAAEGLQGLVMDDLHFADAASVEMLQALLTDARRDARTLRWALAYRPAESTSAVKALEAALSDAMLLGAIEVGPLDEPALVELVEQLGLGISAGAVAAQLHRRTGGNPLFVLETLKQAWVEQGMVRLDPTPSLPVPLSVGDLISRRLSRLAAPALALARVAAIAEVDFSIDLATAVLDSSAMHLADALNELEAAQVLHGMQFAHDLVFDSVQHSVPRTLALHLHAQVAVWLEQHEGEPARIAKHWLQADQAARGVPALKQAARTACRGLRLDEATTFLLQAAEIEQGQGQAGSAFATLNTLIDNGLLVYVSAKWQVADRLDALARSDLEQAIAASVRGKLLTFDWRLREARPQLEKAIALLRGLDDPQRIVDVEGVLATTLAMNGDFDAAWPLFERVETALACDPGLQAPAAFAHNYAMALDQAGRVRDAYPRHLASLQRKHDGASLAQGLSNLAVNRYVAGDMRAARDYAQKSLRTYAALDTPGASGGVPTMTQARADRALGAWQQAMEGFESVTALAEQTPSRRGSLRLCMAEVWSDLGQFARAQSALEQVDTTSGAIVKHVATARCEAARLRRWRGQPHVATLPEIAGLLPEHGAPDVRLRAIVEDSYALPARAARERLTQVVSQARVLGLEGLVTMGLTAMASVLANVDPGAAAVAAEQALLHAQTWLCAGLCRAEVWLAAVHAFDAAGRPDRARDCVQQAVAWLGERVRLGDVPPPFVESFMHRNPVNAALLALAARAPET